MEVELFTDETSEDENYGFDDISEDYLNFEGERCGICTDVVIDRGVLDCCQHWFCFACIDNWATITSLCPLCQNEFQLITCVPVYDTVGGNKTDDDTNPREDDWLIEGKTNTLAFPSYYIDENAVLCLDGDGCKIRSGSVAIKEDSDIDTSIACDSCDKWYHAFCVEFDAEGPCDSSWLCPRCTTDKSPQKSDRVSVLTYPKGIEIAGGNCLAEASFSGRVSVSVADEGETAVVISLVGGNKESQESNVSVLGCSKDREKTLVSCSISDMPNLEALPEDRNSVEPHSCRKEMEISLPQDDCYSPIRSMSPTELKISADDAVRSAPSHINNKLNDSGLDLDHGLPMGSDTPDMNNNDIAEDHVPGSLEPNNKSEDLLRADNQVPDEMEVFSLKSMIGDEKETISGIAGFKRKHRDSRYADDGEREANPEAKSSRKKMKSERNSQSISPIDHTAVSVLDDTSATSSRSGSRGSTFKYKPEKENGISDIMDIVQGTERRSLKQLGGKKSSNITPNEKESTTGLRLKKIMRRASDDKDSLGLVQELRKQIRDAVRNKSSEEIGQDLFDPKLLDAFRTALAGSGAENSKPLLDVKAKRALLQKGKVRENLTKKIYGIGGRRKRAWTRDCEVEFWKHRCVKATKPEKIQALNSVLDLLRDNSDCTKKMPRTEDEVKGSSILSRLYLADTSVFPRKSDIAPVSTLKGVANPEENKDSCSTEKISKPPTIDQSDRKPGPPLDCKETKKSIKGIKSETSPSDAHQKGIASAPASRGLKKPSEKDMASKTEVVKGDKRKWALELLARKTAASGKNMQEKEEDSTILKGSYTLLGQLPKDMRPVLAPSRHNKIPISLRQAQLYRLTEHFLKKANLSAECRTAETELAVADAVNIEKQIADRSNSKLVYTNLCSQELLRRSDTVNSERAEEITPCSTSERLSDGALVETNDSSSDLSVDEALRKAGLLSDSPPNSPDHPTDEMNGKVVSPENSDDEEPENVIEVDSNLEPDIYGDFEYSLEDDDFFGAGSLNVCKSQPEPPKIKLLFSSLKPEKPNEIMGPTDHEGPTDGEALAGSPGLVESQKNTSNEGSTVDTLVQNPAVDNDEELSLAECEELYGPDIEPLIEKYPETISIAPVDQTVNNESPGENAAVDESKQSQDVVKRDKTKSDAKQSEQNSMVVKKVEAYIKEHIRPLCKSGVINVDQYRWAVGKTTEKVMKYHSKERDANFLIKEGEKVKKLAEQYVEASQQKSKT